MNSIAIYIEGTCIYWSSILIVAGIIAGLSISLTLYSARNKYLIGFFFYIPNVIIISLAISRLLYWFSFQEQFNSINEAFSSFEKGGYLIPGIIIGCILTAFIFRLIRVVPSVSSLLDPLAPGLAFMIGIFKMSTIFSDICQGKLFITINVLQKLPFAVKTIDGNGNIQYRLATFFITAICLFIISVVLIIISIINKYNNGDLFNLFLLLYGLVEVIMDSTRYDCAHMTIPGQTFEGLNKALGFIGVGQLFAALSLLYVFCYYFTKSVKEYGYNLQTFLILLMFIIGFGIAGLSEYLVQRYTSMMSTFYLLMLAGLVIIGISTNVLTCHRGRSFCHDLGPEGHSS